MDAIISLLEIVGEDGTILAILLGLSGLSLTGMLAFSLIRSRNDLRRRANHDVGGASRPSRAEAHQSLERLMTYLETTFANQDQRQTRLLRLQMVQAGFFDQRAPAVFFAARFAAAFVLGLGSLTVLPFILGDTTASNLWLYAAGLGIIGYFVPSTYVSRRIVNRTDQHRLGFPDFMDLMVVCSEAGLSMEASIERIARELVEGYPSLAENLYMVSLEMRAGKAFGEALERLGQRLGIEEATMLATLLQQSAELGTSLATSLRVYSEEMRNKRMSRAEEKAYALPAKLVVPLILFVFPVLLVTLMLPVVIRLSGAF